MIKGKMIDNNVKDNNEGSAFNVSGLDFPIYRLSSFREVSKASRGDAEGLCLKSTNKIWKKLAACESGMGGLAFSSGRAAVSAVFSLFNVGDNIIVPDNLYGWSFSYAAQAFKMFGLSYKRVDITNYDHVAQAFEDNIANGGTAAIFIETPSNPLMDVTDIAMISSIAKKYDAKVIVDNTIMTPYLQNPLTCGADLVIHQNIRYICGESSNIEGGIVVTEEPDSFIRLKTAQRISGNGMSSSDIFMLIRGIDTIASRMDKHDRSGAKISGYLQRSPYVTNVYYPGDQSSRNYRIQLRQARGFGGMMSFAVRDDVDKEVFLDSLKLISKNKDEMGIKSRIHNPKVVKHTDLTQKDQEVMKLSANLFQFWAGMEDVDHLIADFEGAFEAATKGKQK